MSTEKHREALRRIQEHSRAIRSIHEHSGAIRSNHLVDDEHGAVELELALHHVAQELLVDACLEAVADLRRAQKGPE